MGGGTTELANWNRTELGKRATKLVVISKNLNNLIGFYLGSTKASTTIRIHCLENPRVYIRARNFNPY